jgi:hypothetical protein
MNKKTMYIWVFILVVIAVGALAYMNFSSVGGSKSFNELIGQTVPRSVVLELSVPSALSNRLVEGSAATQTPQGPTVFYINASPLMNGTKPEILYIGAEYCPYCAITRWGMIIAMSRFGNFSGLHYTASNSTDVYPNTPTFTFYNATYQSNYISFVGVETTTRNRYQPLQNPTPFENSLFSTYDPGGGIPFIDFANQTIQLGAVVDPAALQGYSWSTAISNLTETNSSVSQALIGEADIDTALICKATNMTPSSICAQPYISKILTSIK